MLDNDNDNDNDSDSDSDSDSDNDKDKNKNKGKNKGKNKAKNKVKTVTYRLKFIDSYRFMQDSLSNLVDNLSEINNKMSYASLIEKFPNTYQLCNKDLNKFALLLRKGVYPYEYMDKWKRFNEESLPDKEYFHSEMNKEHILMKAMHMLK